MPRVTAADIVRVIEQKGFALARQSGGHMVFRNEEGRRTTVPFHGNEILHPKTLQSILNDVGMTREVLEKALKE